MSPYKPMIVLGLLLLAISSCHPPLSVSTRKGGVLNDLHDSKVVVKNSQNIHIYIYQDSISIDTLSK